MEDVEQDVVGISGMRKLAGVFNIRGDCGDIGEFDNWFNISCWLSSKASADISNISGCSMTGG